MYKGKNKFMDSDYYGSMEQFIEIHGLTKQNLIFNVAYDGYVQYEAIKDGVKIAMLIMTIDFLNLVETPESLMEKNAIECMEVSIMDGDKTLYYERYENCADPVN